MDSIKNFITKYHTYVVAFVAFCTMLAQVAFGIVIPTWVYDLEAAVGLGSIRVTQTQITGSIGWKTYAVAFGLATLAALRAYGLSIPVEVDTMIATLGGASMTSAIKNA